MLHEALITVPIGPVQISPIWFARSRLGINVFGCKVWGLGIQNPNGCWVLLVSRVGEHTTNYSVACLYRILEVVGPADKLANHWRFFFDKGPHFCSWNCLGTIGVGLHEKYMVAIDMIMGPENHFKNPCDGVFGRSEYEKRICFCSAYGF